MRGRSNNYNRSASHSVNRGSKGVNLYGRGKKRIHRSFDSSDSFVAKSLTPEDL